MRAIALITLLLATASARARRARGKLSLQDAVQAAMHIDPLVSEAHITADRARLGVLRAQLDRVQPQDRRLGAGAVEQEQHRRPDGLRLLASPGTTFQTDQATCTMNGGVSSPSAVQQPSQWTGLLELSGER